MVGGGQTQSSKEIWMETQEDLQVKVCAGESKECSAQVKAEREGSLSVECKLWLLLD